MKNLLILLSLLSSLSAFAGDLGLWCYENGDRGESIAMVEFSQGNRVALTLSRGQNDYVILVTRKELFSNYRYEIIKIDRADQENAAFTKMVKKVSNYETPVQIDDFQCSVND